MRFHTVEQVFDAAKKKRLEPVAIVYVNGVPTTNIRVGTPLTRPHWKVVGRYPKTFPCRLDNKMEVFKTVTDWASVRYNVRTWKRFVGMLPQVYFSDTIVDTFTSVDTQ